MEQNNNINQHVCKVCTGKDYVLWGKHSDHNLFKCQKCNLVFFYPYPTQQELDDFYNDTYHVDRGYDGESSKAGALRKQMYNLDIKDLKKFIPFSEGKFLDVGCAEGAFLSMLGNSWEKFGIDVSAPAIESACARGINASVRDIDDCEDEYYDVVHLRGVFEHILDPKAFVAKTVKKLRKGGYLVLSNTPNTDGIVPSLYRGKFRLVLPNEHVNYFGPKTMKIMLAEAGFEVEKIIFPYFGSPYCSFWKNLLSVGLNKIKGEASPPFYGNIMTVFARKI